MPDTICDTSPLQRLHQTELLELLATLYEKVIVPEAVAAELREGKEAGIAMPDVEQYAWIEVRPLRDPTLVSVKTGLGPGERAALGMAMETPGSRLIMDDPLARRHARLLRQSVTGTIGVLLKAKRRGLISKVGPVLDRLDANGIGFTADARTAVLTWAGES